ncbi:MAG: hypothetical protein KME27_16215 [Lyngbya sp. HA4199-MV5]|jgi:hypothetical protein|nr:hypothetical protein [Lyngbya sp. HA4199-MV5]
MKAEGRRQEAEGRRLNLVLKSLSSKLLTTPYSPLPTPHSPASQTVTLCNALKRYTVGHLTLIDSVLHSSEISPTGHQHE